MPIPEQYVIADLQTALSKQLYPTITVWNRLEGRPRTVDFDRALKAEVRDALWMMTKQWQIGEFFADDAGSPVFAKVRMRTSDITKYQAANGTTEGLAQELPLEAKVEQQSLVWTWNGQKMRFDLRAQLGRQWRKLLDAAGLSAYLGEYLTHYPIALPKRDSTTDYIYAHRRGWQLYAALAGRSIDGGDLYIYLTSDPSHHASDGIAPIAPADKAALDALGEEFVAWFAAQYQQPSTKSAWKPEYLEYQFACSAPQAGNPVVLEADEYAHGHVDWYSFDRSTPSGGLGGPADPAAAEQVAVNSFIPTSVTFQGMPEPRWWTLEDRKTDFGKITPATTDLAQLLLMEFGLVYGNDWFLVPFRIPAASLALVEGLAVTNNFGERFWIVPAGMGKDDNWHRWSMFNVSSTGGPQQLSDQSLLIPPGTANILDGDALEEIELGRDEVANMAWAVERIVPTLSGPGRFGKDEARETRQYHEQAVAPIAAPPSHAAPVSYLAMTGVPEHWIPFIPAHVPGSVREIQLQRGRMLRIMEGDPTLPLKIPPRTTLIRHGLDSDKPQPYFLHEEEVPRAGVTVRQTFRRTRWTHGEACVWLGVRKQTGRGERRSGLAFDSIVNTPGSQ